MNDYKELKEKKIYFLKKEKENWNQVMKKYHNYL